MRTTGKLALMFALVFGSTTRAAAQQAPDPARQRMALDLLRAMNARDTVALRRFVDEHFATSGPGVPSPAERVTRLGRIRSNLGELQFRKVDSSTANEFVTLVQSPRTDIHGPCDHRHAPPSCRLTNRGIQQCVQPGSSR